MTIWTALCCLIFIWSKNTATLLLSADPGDEDHGGIPTLAMTDDDIFRRNLIERRADHVIAIERLQATDNAISQHKMISVMAHKLFIIIEDSKGILDNAGFLYGSAKLPKDRRAREALINFVETTALLCDFLVFIPHATERLLSLNLRWRVLLIDSIEFASSLSFIDEDTMKQFHQASDILSRFQRDDISYMYKTDEKKKKERKKLKRGPRLSARSLLDEL